MKMEILLSWIGEHGESLETMENMAKIVRDGVGDDGTVGRAGIAHEMDAGTRTQRKSLKAWQKQHAAAEHAVRDDMHDLWSQ